MHRAAARRPALAPLALLTLLALAVLALAACGGADPAGDPAAGTPSATASGSAGESGSEDAAATDGFKAAWPKAQESVAALADDSVLLSAGTSGLALADVPASWSFVFYSPGTGRVYSVAVEHGAAREAQDLGPATSDTDVSAAMDVREIEVGAADAVVKARAFGEKSGAVPRNVMVGGAFVDLPGAADLDVRPGVWTVTFASGTDLADAQKYDVDMMTGEVTAVED